MSDHGVDLGMSNEKIKDLLTKLHAELQSTDVDTETRSLMKELDADIHSLLESNDQQDDAGSILERAQLLETDFANSHPVAERFIREIVETLARMGV